MSLNDQQKIWLVPSMEDKKAQVFDIWDIKEYSQKLYDASVASNEQTPGKGGVLMRVHSVSVKALVSYMSHKPIAWETWRDHKRPVMFKEVWDLAKEWEVYGLRERLLEELREWTNPEYNDLKYRSDNVAAICRSDFPSELFNEIVKVWAKYAMAHGLVKGNDTYKAIYRDKKFGDAVQEEMARIGGGFS